VTNVHGDYCCSDHRASAHARNDAGHISSDATRRIAGDAIVDEDPRP
jgi:hypothetical protein